jgi:hypothetical protein
MFSSFVVQILVLFRFSLELHQRFRPIVFEDCPRLLRPLVEARARLGPFQGAGGQVQPLADLRIRGSGGSEQVRIWQLLATQDLQFSGLCLPFHRVSPKQIMAKTLGKLSVFSFARARIIAHKGLYFPSSLVLFTKFTPPGRKTSTFVNVSRVRVLLAKLGLSCLQFGVLARARNSDESPYDLSGQVRPLTFRNRRLLGLAPLAHTIAPPCLANPLAIALHFLHEQAVYAAAARAEVSRREMQYFSGHHASFFSAGTACMPLVL